MKIGYLFILNNADHINSLKQSLIKVKDSNPIWIGVINEIPDYHQEIIYFLNNFNCPFNVVCNLDKVPDIFKLDQFKTYKNGWTVVRIAGENIVDNIDLLDKYISDGNKAAIIKHDNDSINGMCFFNFIYKFLKGSKYEVNEDTKEVISKTFEEKVLEKDPNMITTWDKINEIYSHSSNIR
jgi:hypothetical protein